MSSDVVLLLQTLYPGYTWPAREVPRWAVSSRVCCPWKLSRRGIKERYGKRYSLSLRRAVSEVAASFRPVSDTLRDTIESLQVNGIIDLHARKPSTSNAKARVSSRLSNVGLGGRPTRRNASGRV